MRGLKRFELGEDFNGWVFNFYNEMVEKDLHQYFPYDDETTKLAKPIKDRIKASETKVGKTLTDNEKLIIKEKEHDRAILARSYLVRCLTPQTSRSLNAVKLDGHVGSLWQALISQCRSKNAHSLREIYHQIINIKMKTTESLISYQGRIQ